MGLDNFRTDNGNNKNGSNTSTNSDTDTSDNSDGNTNVCNDGADGGKAEIDLNDTDNTKKETPTNDSSSGLDSFKTESNTSNNSGNKTRSEANPWIDDFTADEWNSMKTEEKVKYVRENYYKEYRPHIELDEEWEYRTVIEVDCVCGNTFTFRKGGLCFQCNRKYEFTMGEVNLVYSPKDNND